MGKKASQGGARRSASPVDVDPLASLDATAQRAVLGALVAVVVIVCHAKQVSRTWLSPR